MIANVRVHGRETYQFAVIVHQARSPEEILLPMVGFYGQPLFRDSQDQHHELELMEGTYYGLEVHPHRSQVHIHTIVDQEMQKQRAFINHPWSIPQMKDAEEVFKKWSLGTAFTLQVGEDWKKHPCLKQATPLGMVAYMQDMGYQVQVDTHHLVAPAQG